MVAKKFITRSTWYATHLKPIPSLLSHVSMTISWAKVWKWSQDDIRLPIKILPNIEKLLWRPEIHKLNAKLQHSFLMHAGVEHWFIRKCFCLSLWRYFPQIWGTTNYYSIKRQWTHLSLFLNWFYKLKHNFWNTTFLSCGKERKN